MKLRTRLMALSLSTVAVIVTVLFALHLDSLGKLWLDSALERNVEVAKLIRDLIVEHIADATANSPGVGLEETKQRWNNVVANDQDLGYMLVQQAAVRASVIVEINVIGEDGTVIVSSIPSRLGHRAPKRMDLQALRDSGFFGRLAAIATSRTDYESRLAPLGIPDQKKPIFQVQLLVSPVLLRDKILPELKSTAVVSLFALFAAAGLAIISAHLALLPVRRIGEVVDTLATGQPLDTSATQESRDDREVAAVEYKLSLLGEQMKGARRDADQMRTTIGSLARGVAHEIRNPLNAISLRLEGLRMRIADEVPEAEADIDLVSNEVQRLNRVVRTFLDLNRPMEPEIQEFDPVELASTVIEILRPLASRSLVELQLKKPEAPLRVHADRGLIEQVVMNLMNNAIQAMGEGGRIEVEVSHEGNNCEIAVTDNGPGMPESVRERIFEPYFTTKPTGTGIGLAFTKRVMELHRGGIQVKTAPGEGTTMTLSFPVERAT